MLAWILAFSIIAGQLIKIPIGTHGGVTLLDTTVISLCFWGIVKLKFHLKKPPLFVASAIFFILIALLSLALTPLHLTPIEYFTSLSYTLRFSLYVLLGWIIYSHTFPILQKNIPSILTISGLGLAFLGLLQFIFLPNLGFLTNWGWDPHYFRTASTFLDPNFLGAYFVLTLILLISLPDRLLPHLRFLAITVVYLALLTTFSRGAYLAFLTSFISLSFLRKSFRTGIFTIILFLGLLLAFSIYQKAVAQPRGVDRAQSAEFRFSTWQQGWQLFSSHPLLGVGFNAYKFALREYNLGDEQFLKSHGASTNDSSLLYVGATTGVVGLFSYLFFLFTMIRTGKPILIAGLFGLIVQSFFANTLFYPFLFLWLVLTLHQKDC